MRANLGFLGLMLAGSTAAIGFIACGNSVSEVTGGVGGGAGTGGSQSTTTSTTTVTVSASSSSGTTTTSSSSTSSSSGGDNCQMACSHIQMCTGFDLCNMGFNLDCSNPQYDCTATCINNLSCGDLNIQSGQACLQKCAPQDAGPIDAGDPCMNACAHVQQCFGFDVCAQLPNQLDCSNPQNECIANCVNGYSCSQLSFQTFQACQAQCQNTGDGGTPTDGGAASDGGGSAQACQQCAQQGCFQALGGCFQNNACQSWLQCIQGCNMNNPVPSCYTDCDAQNASAKMQYDAVYACTCMKCDAECASTSNPCGMH